MGQRSDILSITHSPQNFIMNYKSISVFAFAFCAFLIPSGYAEETKNNATCIACEITVEALEEYINFGHNEEAIIGNLTQDCHEAFDELPPFIRPIFLDICIGFVNVTVRDIIDLLQQDMQPEVICTFLGLCDETDEAMKMKMQVMVTALLEKAKARFAPPPPPKSEGPLTCKFCQSAVDKIEELIGFGNFTWDGEVEQQIIAELIQNCKDSLPDSPIAEDTCEMVVNTFMKDLMDLFREVMNQNTSVRSWVCAPFQIL